MTQQRTILSTQVARMLEMTESWAQQRCSEINTDADKQAHEAVRVAYAEARKRLRLHFEQERQSFQKRIAAQMAAIKTRQQQEQQQEDARFLAQAWELLVERLLQRWSDAEQRDAWIIATLQEAGKVLPGSAWSIDYPADLPQASIQRAEDWVERHSMQKPEMHLSETLSAGICIHCDGVTIDASLSGLLADRRRIEAQLLAACRILIEETGEGL